MPPDTRQPVVRELQYQAGPRTTLAPGTLFRVSGGPYYESPQPDGSKRRLRMGYSGPFRFIAYCQRGRYKWIEAYSSKGYCILPLAPRERSPELPALVRQPYRVTGRVRVKAQHQRPRRRALTEGVPCDVS